MGKKIDTNDLADVPEGGESFLNQVTKLIYFRDASSIGLITDYLQECLQNLQHNEYVRSLPEKIAIHWVIVRAQGAIYEVIYKNNSMIRQKYARDVFSIAAVPSYPHKHMVELSRSGFKKIACIETEMTEKDEQKMINEIKNGKYHFLVADPYRFDSKWLLGDMGKAAHTLKSKAKVDPSQDEYSILWIINPEIMTTRQIEQAFDFYGAKDHSNFSTSYWDKEAIMITSTTVASENKVLREKAIKNNEWSVNIIEDNFWDAILENDYNSLAQKIQLIPYQYDPSAVWTLMEHAIKLIKYIQNAGIKKAFR